MKIVNWNIESELEREALLRRPAQQNDRARTDTVKTIINRVRGEGDKALFSFTQAFDKATLNTLKVTEDEFQQAEATIGPDNKAAIQFAIDRITTYQSALKPNIIRVETTDGVVCERQPRPIERVGLYVPGGNTPLISTAMMLAIPAALAGCKIKILCTPPKPNGSIDNNVLFTAKQCGIKTIYKVGGAQAIAAMAYGTETVNKVDKIFGPGNAWVTEAKQQIAQDRNGAMIDMPAGPSEVLVIADDNANEEFVAADLLSQAEHGPDSQVIAIVFSVSKAEAIQNAVTQQLKTLSRQSIVEQSLENSRLIVVDSLDTAIAISNRYAPEHLILQIENAEGLIKKIENAGAVFVGPWTPETAGDYVTGSNHVLPTDGYARTVSGLSICDFMKFISIQRVNETGLKNIAPYAERLAMLEGLDAHKNAATLRLEKINELVS